MSAKVGDIRNPRDERGWRIPADNSFRMTVYRLMVAGKSSSEIIANLESGPRRVHSAVSAIRHPEQNNRGSCEHHRRERAWLRS